MMKLEQLAELHILYPEYKDLSVETLLSGIDKETLFKVSTYLIGKDLFANQNTSVEDLVSVWFSEGNLVFASNFVNRVSTYQILNKKDLVILHNISILKILDYAIANQAEIRVSKSKEQSEIDLLFCLLLLNQTEDFHQTKDINKIKELFSNTYAAALLFNYQFATGDITNFEIIDYVPCQLIKSFYLFQFLETTNEGKELLSRFYNYFQINCYREYFERALPIIFAWINRDVPSSVDLVLENNGHYIENYNFLKKFALNSTNSIEGLDFKHLREKPLIQLNDTTFRIIHPLFIADKIYKGNYFLLNFLNSQQQKIVADFMSWFTTHFSENYLFKQLINYCFPKTDICLFDNDYLNKGIQAAPDCYIKMDNDVLLFENKDILINGNIKASYNFESTINEIKKKLLLKKEKPVGIGQLVTHIKTLLNGNKD
ncbi:MAG: hypothetical protein ABL929_11125, partial [Ferruginibacter sp.]